MKLVLGLGGNVGDVAEAFHMVSQTLVLRLDTVPRARSRLYRTAPVGPEQPRYLNAALLVETALPPREFLGVCLEIEGRAGRKREAEVPWGPRTLDLDLLLIENLVCRGPVLDVPHPFLAERAFALLPAAEVAPDWVHPLSGRTLDELAKKALQENPSAVEWAEPWPDER
ncbi:MAG: 2-amino-4-hydroxy-6-hydroxymethyldihydropteridine diphosphokinase [Thermoanaerobaculales bacterium]|nr:2-amino-4-hydroxy-6-hydroxymethyldihydropteridine diphosphokinase [Thermoanaerobaculales bacterium]